MRWLPPDPWPLLPRALVFAGVSLSLMLLSLGYRVWLRPGGHLTQEYIEEVIAQESPVFYRDGETRLGSLFAREHRVYVPYSELPQRWRQAIVAAEDRNFWNHQGIDPEGVARAMWLNLSSLSLVAGGSTLTQQTAKNLYYRPDRSLSSKIEEALNALRLEVHYSKENILEWYANQFHVSGNGRGIGIAARYFFDKEAKELDLLESAFIAGLVKAPSRYNPFIGSTERQSAAYEKATDRTHYVLRRMHEEGAISSEELREALETPLTFRRGDFRSEGSVVIDAIRKRLESSPFLEIFEEAGIDNPSTAGIQITTTLEEGAQRQAVYSLWHELTGLGSFLEQSEASDFLIEELRSGVQTPPKPGEFRVARVTGVDEEGVSLDLSGHPGRLDSASLKRAQLLLARARTGQRWVQAQAADREALDAVLQEGAGLLVSVRPDFKGEPPYLCDLELRPELQGAALAIERGQIRAMVGGNDNRGYNRALSAQRQLGSSWKPLLYLAALQLKWLPEDMLDNRRGWFLFEGSWFGPSFGHEPEPFVSLGWAGVNSENLASTWLLYHLTDRLLPEELMELAEVLDLAPRPAEPRPDYIERIRDQHGIIATTERMAAGHFLGAKSALIPHLESTERRDQIPELLSLYPGSKLSSSPRRRGAWEASRSRQLSTLQSLRELCQPAYELLAQQLPQPVEGKDEGPRWPWGKLMDRLNLDEVEIPDLELEDLAPLAITMEGELAQLACQPEELEQGWERLETSWLRRLRSGVLRLEQRSYRLQGRISSETLGDLEEAIAALEQEASSDSELDPYALRWLIYHPDFRRLLNMRYLSALAHASGIKSPVEPVLSMTLGPSVVSLEEMLSVYQLFLDGRRWLPRGGSPDRGLLGFAEEEIPLEGAALIAEIRDQQGQLLYRLQEDSQEVTASSYGQQVQHMLSNVVEHGTARSARGALSGWPAGGKTGTTNESRNTAFLGYVLSQHSARLAPHRGWVVGSYVGYDDNRPLSRKGSSFSGASAALPVWTRLVAGIRDQGLLGSPEDLEVDWPHHLTLREVDEHSGGLLQGSEEDPDEGAESSGAFLLTSRLSALQRQYSPPDSMSEAWKSVESANNGPVEPSPSSTQEP